MYMSNTNQNTLRETANKRANGLIEFVRNHNIDEHFYFEAGMCINYKLLVEATISQLNNYDCFSVYWKSAFLRLRKLKYIIIERQKNLSGKTKQIVTTKTVESTP